MKQLLLPLSCLAILVACGDDSESGTTSSSGGSPSGGSGGTETGGGGQGGGAAGGSGAQGGVGAAGASGGMGGMGGGGGVGLVGEGCDPDSMGLASIESAGESGKYLLKGLVARPAPAFEGEVLIVDDTIACVDLSCSAHPDAATAHVIQTNGVILPGFIDTHNHVQFNIFDEDDWTPTVLYTNHNQWSSNDDEYAATLDAKQYLNGEGSPVNLSCELNKWGELKALFAGTTSMLGASKPANKTCYRTLTRTIDQSANGLCGTQPPQSCPDKVQVASIWPNSTSANGVCANYADGDTDAYFIHVGEGTDMSALNEFNTLVTTTTPDGCLIADQTNIVHGTAFTQNEFAQMGMAGAGLVWSPKSNVFLYGGGNDLSATTDIPTALAEGITVSIAPDWSLGGAQNLLEELRFADQVDNSVFGDLLSPEELVHMVTVYPAEQLGLAGVLGELTVGAKADIMVLARQGDAYDTVLKSTPEQVRLVFVDGVPLFGDAALEPIAQTNPACETFDACGCSKFACIAAAGGDSVNLFGQTLAEIEMLISDAMLSYDTDNGTSFSPVSPLVRCAQ